MGYIPLALTIASAAISTYSTYQQGAAQKKAARVNQRIAEQQAADARRRGDYEESVQRRRTAILIGHETAAIGASGIDVGSVSAARLLEDQAAIGELDALMARTNGQREAWGFERLGANYKFDEYAGKLTQTLGAGSEALGGAIKSYSAYKAGK